jgi:uncharacterized membrane protein
MIALRPIHILLLATLVAFGASLAAPFHLDDYALFSDPAITSPSGWWEVWKPLQTRPLTWFTFWINFQLGGRNPAGYHAVSLALHLAAVWLVYATLRSGVTGNDVQGGRPSPVAEFGALMAAAVFALHPIQAEAVNYVFDRGTLLATVFCLLTLRSWREGREWHAAGWFALALLSKEECVTFPVFLLLAARAWRPAMGVMFGLSAAAGARLLVATAAVRGSGAGVQAGIAPLEYLGTQGLVILRYLRLLVAPYGFTVDPDIRISHAWWAWAVILGVAALLWWRHRHGWWFAAGLILLAPSSTILPAADLAADRRLYLPMLAFAALAGLLLERFDRRLGVALAGVLLVLSFGRTQTWASEQSLWREAVERAPNKVRPLIQYARTCEPRLALQVLERAKSLAPDDPRVATERGRRYLEWGQPAAALGEFGRALALAPNDPQAVNNRGVALLLLGQKDAAVADFRRALRLEPSFPDAAANLKRLGVEVR